MLSKLLIYCLLLVFANVFTQEICDNGIDDDADGLIDLNDTLDCNCDLVNAQTPSLILNPSFEDTVCCPTAPSQMTCAELWVQASAGTTDYLNTCGLSTIYAPPQYPIPGGGNGYVGFTADTAWNEYAGACLNGSMIAGTSYTINFYTAWSSGVTNMDFTIYGTPNCSDLPWTGSACPLGSGAWQVLGAQTVTYQTTGAWQQVTITFTPTININAIALGGSCLTPQVAGSNYYFMDELTLNTSFLVTGVIPVTGNWCTNDLMIDATTVLGPGSFQWYLNNIALVGETGPTLNAMTYGLGDYSLIHVDTNNYCTRSDFLLEAPVYPVSDFNQVGLGCVSVNADFTDLSVNASAVPIVSWEWDMGDNTILNSINPSHMYSSPGVYDVSLVVTSDEGCSDTSAVPVTISPDPVAVFEFNVDGTLYQVSEGDTIQICDGSAISFYDQSTVANPDMVSTFNWNFGDFSGASQQNPIHQYAIPNTYNVELEVGSNNGCLDTFNCFISINPIPNAGFSMTNSCLNTPVIFSNTSTIQSGSIIVNQWDFGNSAGSGFLNPVYQYTTPGVYNIELQIESDFGCVDSITQQITIQDVPTAAFQISGNCENEWINFFDQSTIVNTGLSAWEWNFGDNNTSAFQSPGHQYADDGTYTVQLIVENLVGCTDTAESQLTVYPKPDIGFLADNACEGVPVNLSNTTAISSGTIQQYNWQFDNGLTSGQEEPTNVYFSTPGFHNITLIADSDMGCSNTLTQSVLIYPKPLADIIGGPHQYCVPHQVVLENTVDGITDQCYWDFGDGDSDYGCGSIEHKYMSSGQYDVKLKVYSVDGCVDSMVLFDFVVMEETPLARFRYKPQDLSIDQSETNFINESINAASYLWDFDDGSPTVTDENPVHAFPNKIGSYDVRLEVANQAYTCFDEAIRHIEIKNEVIFYVPNAFSPGYDGSNDIFNPVMTAGIDIYKYKFSVFNRWGELLFVTNDISKGWDGSYRGSELVQNGVYVWQIEYSVFNKDERVTEQGIVNVIR